MEKDVTQQENKYLPVPMETVNCFEVWWPVEGDIYYKGELILHIPLGEIEASNIGRIRSLNYGMVKGNVQVIGQHFLHGGKLDNDWLGVKIFEKPVKSHTIIALAFIGERPEGYDVDHINYDRSDNRYTNLRYLSKSENSGRHSFDGKNRMIEASKRRWEKEGEKELRSQCLSLRWNTDDEYRNTIGKNLKKGRSNEYDDKRKEGLRNKYKEEEYRAKKSNQLKEINVRTKSKPVLQYTLYGEFIKEWPSAREAARALGYSQANISNCCNGRYKQAYGYIWRNKVNGED